MKAHIAIGIAALLTWFFLFAAGIAVDSSPYRKALAGAGTSALRAGAATASTGTVAESLEDFPKITKLTAFLGVIAFYTPLNVALLTILAGLVGGCASRLTWVGTGKEGTTRTEDDVKDIRAMFRTEPPVASMLRSFLVYLAFIAGIFITTNDPFANPTPDQYVRIAGLLSFVSFGVGYDPTRFQYILSLKPGGRDKG